MQSLPSLAKDLGKKTPDVKFIGEDILFSPSTASVLQNVFMHCFRNSIDHGIENAKEREQQGKREKGKITVGLKRNEGKIEIHFQDDGKGLNLERIKDKGIENGILPEETTPSDEEIAALIFNSGMSTAEKLTHVSGRGVGMDAVRGFLQEASGKIQLHYTGERKDNGYRPFKFLITLPESVALP